MGKSGVRSHLVGMKGHRSNAEMEGLLDLSLWVEGKFKSKENMDRQSINPHKNRKKTTSHCLVVSPRNIHVYTKPHLKIKRGCGLMIGLDLTLRLWV